MSALVFVPVLLEFARVIEPEDAERVECGAHGRELVRERVSLTGSGQQEARLWCAHAVHGGGYLARYTVPTLFELAHVEPANRLRSVSLGTSALLSKKSLLRHGVA